MSCLGGEEFRSEVACGLVVGVAALAGFSVLELGVGWEETLVVGWASEGLFATGLRIAVSRDRSCLRLGWLISYWIKGWSMGRSHIDG